VGITEIKTNEKMKNVLKEFNRKHFTNQEKITIARMIREQLQLTSWYLTESFLKYKVKTSKIEINGFADPTNGRGGYSYINKPQKERTSKEDMEDRAEKQRSSALQDLRKLKVDDSKEKLRQMGHNEDEIDFKGRWQLINLLKNK
jgi:MoxR-like ATPase